MTADMGSDIRQLYSANIVVPLDHMVKAVFPMHRHSRVTVFVCEKESGITVHHPLTYRFFPVLDERPEALRHAFRHRQLPFLFQNTTDFAE